MNESTFEKLDSISKGLQVLAIVEEDETNHRRAMLLKEWSKTIDDYLTEVLEEEEKNRNEK